MSTAAGWPGCMKTSGHEYGASSKAALNLAGGLSPLYEKAGAR